MKFLIPLPLIFYSLTSFANIADPNVATSFYNDDNISISLLNSLPSNEEDSDYLSYSAVNPVAGSNQDGIKTEINNKAIVFNDNVTAIPVDTGCFNSTIDILSFDKNKTISKTTLTFKRNDNPYPNSIYYCFMGQSTIPDYITKYQRDLFFINSYGVSYYNLDTKKKINLPITLNNEEQKNNVIYTEIINGKLEIVVENISDSKDKKYFQVSTKS